MRASNSEMNHVITVRRDLALAHPRLRLLARRPVERRLLARRARQRAHGERVGGERQLQQGKDHERGRLLQRERPHTVHTEPKRAVRSGQRCAASNDAARDANGRHPATATAGAVRSAVKCGGGAEGGSPS